jgi:hypothetical protein
MTEYFVAGFPITILTKALPVHPAPDQRILVRPGKELIKIPRFFVAPYAND